MAVFVLVDVALLLFNFHDALIEVICLQVAVWTHLRRVLWIALVGNKTNELLVLFVEFGSYSSFWLKLKDLSDIVGTKDKDLFHWLLASLGNVKEREQKVPIPV